MIKREVRGIRITHDGRGKISAGTGTAGKMKKLDHFNVSAFPEIIEQYGEKPTKLLVVAPAVSAIEQFFEDSFELWGRPKDAGADVKGTLKRSCDGETAIFRTEQVVDGKRHGAGEEGPCVCKDLPKEVERKGRMVPNPEICRYHCRVKFFVANPRTGKVQHPLCYLFDTHSINSGKAVYSELEKVEQMNRGILSFVQFLMSVKLVQDKRNIKNRFPVWQLEVVGALAGRAIEAPKDVTRMLTQGSAEVIDEDGPSEVMDDVPPDTPGIQAAAKPPIDPDRVMSAKTRRTAEQLLAKATKSNVGSVKRYIDDRFREGQLVEDDHRALADIAKVKMAELGIA